MSHPFGDLLSQYLHRKHGLSQARLAEGILQDPTVITRMCKGERLTGPQARERVLSIIGWLHQRGALDTINEANALLESAGMSGLREADLPDQFAERPGPISFPVEPGIVASPSSGGNSDNLPVMSTPFIGRATDLARIGQLLSDPRCRLLTLAGPGGVGKTRLAIEAASLRRGSHVHSAHFVNLESVDDAPGVPAAIADGLRIALRGRDAPALQLQRYLASKSVLLILDGFEHLIGAAGLLADVLAAAPGVQALVTSREVLNLREEWQYAVTGLSVPAKAAPLAETDMSHHDGVRLFADCASRIAPFDPVRDAASAARICQLTEGLPLAIEMAAAWAKTMTCAEIAAELERGLYILTARQRNVPARHSSMQIVFDQSWGLLAPDERAAFARLAVFRGGFQRKAAVEVAGATLEILSSLVDKSFLCLTSEGRYQVHDLLRQYGEAKLTESIDDLNSTLEKHARYFEFFLIQDARPHIPEFHISSIRICHPELDNIRAAWRWAVQNCDTRMLRAVASPVFLVFQWRCSYLEAVTVLGFAARRLMAGTETSDIAGALFEVHHGLGWGYFRLGRLEESEQSAQECLRLQRRHDLTPMYGYSHAALGILSNVASIRGNHAQAEAFARQLHGMPSATTGTDHLTVAQFTLSVALLNQGRLDEAEQAISRAIDLCKQQRGRWRLSHCFTTLGNIERARGNWGRAGLRYQAAYEILEECGDPEGMASALNKLGDVALEESEVKLAGRRFADSLALYRDLNDRGGLATTLKGLGDVARIDGHFRRAAGYYRESLGIARDMGHISLIFTLFVAVADLHFRMGSDEVAAHIAALASDHPSSAHDTALRARALLAEHGLDAPQPAPDIVWETAFAGACDAIARALDALSPHRDRAAEWQLTDG